MARSSRIVRTLTVLAAALAVLCTACGSGSPPPRLVTSRYEIATGHRIVRDCGFSVPSVFRIASAIDQKEKILVYGDYDVDGTASVACMFQFLQKICQPELIDFYIPHRYREGYGVSKAGIDFAKENGGIV